MTIVQFAVMADTTDKAQHMKQILCQHYDVIDIEAADYAIIIGGDGFMLHCLRNHYALNIKFFGINTGNVGFLLNPAHDDIIYNLPNHLAHAQEVTIYPLMFEIYQHDGAVISSFAFNEVAIQRQEGQAIHLDIIIDGHIQMSDYIADGLLVASPVGSSAYNFACDGPILPLNTNLCALTPISVYRPRRWRGALINRNHVVKCVVNDSAKRPALVSADSTIYHHVTHLEIHNDKSHPATLLFHQDYHLEERLFQEQFI